MRKYKDVHRVTKEGVHTRWERQPIDIIPLWIERAKLAESQHISTTIQTFFQPRIPGAGDEPEEFGCDFYVDFDGDLSTNKTRAPLESAFIDTKTLAFYFNNAGVASEDILLWFTGGRGFHLVIPRQVFGARSSPYLHKVWLIIARDIRKELGLETLDFTVYGRRRMWRVGNTKNVKLEPDGSIKSELYKIPLSLDELAGLSLDEIKSLAVEPRNIGDPEEPPVRHPECVRLYEKALRTLESRQKDKDWEPAEVYFEDPPPCIKAILSQGAFEVGQVNMIAFRLAAYFKTQNIPLNEAIGLMGEWVLKLTPDVVSDFDYQGNVDYEKLREQAAYTTNSVYANPRYGFSCGGILQIPQIENYCTEECRDTIVGEVEVDLFSAFSVENLGKRLKVVAEAIGAHDESYAIPEKIVVECSPIGGKYCASCPLYTTSTLTINMTARHWNILNFLEPSNIPLTGKIGNLLGMPERRKCGSWSYKIKERNVELIHIAPKVSDTFEVAGERYTRKPAYYLGFGLELNQAYAFSGYSHIDRKKNLVKLVLDKAEPLADTLSEFEFTVEMRKKSRIFAPAVGQSYAEKHREIVNSLNYNYVRVWGREDMIEAVDLAFHSPNTFWFQRELIRGWLNVLIIGDTGQGKSKLAETLMRHYNLGFKASGESAGRTGLLYTIPVKENQPNFIVWGILPRYDRRLVFIDELKELIRTGGFAELTEARSSGVVTVTKSVFGRARARTRLVMMTNTERRKPLGSYGYGVASVLDLIPDREDIRRFDYMVGVASSEIDDALININIRKVAVVKDVFASDVCHNHILWVWSLQPEDIVIEEVVEEEILEVAYRMCSEYIATVPLVEPGDFRHKIARTAAAAAARMDSRVGAKLYVTKEAVQYAAEFIDKLYTNPVLDYKGYSDAYAAYMLNEEQMETLINQYKNMFSSYFEVASWLLFNAYTKAAQLAAVIGIPEGHVRQMLNWCAGYKLLEPTSKGSYMKTEIGAEFFRKVVEEGEDN